MPAPSSSCSPAIGSIRNANRAGALLGTIALALLVALPPARGAAPSAAEASSPATDQAWRWIEAAPAEVRSELGITRPGVLPEADDAYPLLAAATKAGVRLLPRERDEPLVNAIDTLTADDEARPDAGDLERVRRHLEENRDALRLLAEAGRRSRLGSPHGGAPERAGAPRTAALDIVRLSNLSELQLARANLLSLDGDFDGSIEELAGALRLGRLVAGGDGPLIQHLVGAATVGLAARGFRRLALDPRTPEAALRRSLDLVAPPWRAREDLAAALCAGLIRSLERLASFPREDDPGAIARALVAGLGPDSMREGVERLLRGHPRLLDREATAKALIARFSRLIRSTREAWRDRPKGGDPSLAKVLEAWPEPLRPSLMTALGVAGDPLSPDAPWVDERQLAEARKKLAGIDNPVGLLLVTLPPFHVAADDAFVLQALRLEADLEATRAILALRLYRKAMGRAAPSFEALVQAGIIREAPRDPFGEGPLRYSPWNSIVWTVGPDGETETATSAVDREGRPIENVWQTEPLRGPGPASPGADATER